MCEQYRFMAPVTRCALSSRGSCLAAAVLALAALASPRRLGASASASASAAERSGPNWHTVSVSSLLPSAVCTAAKAASNSSTLSVVHRHSPCSPLRPRGGAPSQGEILGRDQDRVNSIHRRIAGVSAINASRAASKDMSLPARWGWGTSLGINSYVISIGLGTPARHFSVELDTGSDLSWVQCKPCTDCYEQQDPLFDPARSSTYSAVPCGSAECQELTSQSCSSEKNCRYEVVYGDESQTHGNLAHDTLTLTTPADTIPGFVFGCGHRDGGVFGKLDGLIGLGRDKVSFSSQAAAKYGAGFSYCLPSSSAAGYLSLGAAAPANAQFTAMVTRADSPSFYYLNLVGVKVAGKAIKVPPAVFARAGTIIDSGTAFTYLPRRAYAALRSSFVRAMGSRYKRAPALSFLDTCYDFTGHTAVQLPSVALVFAGGATVSVNVSGVLYVANVSQMCLAFAPNSDDTSMGVIGNTQQKTFAVVYDVANQKIGFGANGCS